MNPDKFSDDNGGRLIKADYEAPPTKAEMWSCAFAAAALALTVAGACFAVATQFKILDGEEFERRKFTLNNFLTLDQKIDLASGKSVPFNLTRQGRVIEQTLSAEKENITFLCRDLGAQTVSAVTPEEVSTRPNYYYGRLKDRQCYLEPRVS